MSNKYNLKWNSHHAEGFGNFELLRNREVLVDITLSCGGQTIKAHKLVLCAGSAFFEKLLQRDTSGFSVVHFHGIDALHLRLLVDFMYLGEVDVPSSELERFIALADSLEVKGLKGDRSKKTDEISAAENIVGRSEFPPYSRHQISSLAPSLSSRPLGVNASPNAASSVPSYLTPVKRRLPVGMNSTAGVQAVKTSPLFSPTPEKRQRPDVATSDVINQALDNEECLPETHVKTEENEIEEIEADQEDLQCYWARDSGMSAAEGDDSQNSYQMEGEREEFDPNEVPPNIPPDIAPEAKFNCVVMVLFSPYIMGTFQTVALVEERF
ncbi:unnamed protein product [Darwinula stevensoni]|uniref:BTB domain-containing protein n=1 Tax=Darwinula stevensoni TaxID=69355 RepID=A0A7R8XB84_9CRUS|nr:unnamed protein product [Darwinula stevensoni]CAG0887464.1 unnamed protein product [Darwinula stevensoni]